MEALLGLSTGRDDAPKNRICSSTEELQLQLTGILEAKVLPTKAEHVSETFELRQNAVFTVDVSDENDPPENPENLDPATTMREIRAIDTVVDQPQDDPILQKAVAKHIASSIGVIDGSSWVVRQVSRGTSGWTFTYICKDSMQSWMRQNARSTARSAVAISSGKDGQDPVTLARPAFDCRGTVTIAFVRSSKLITVKYDHTPFHRTVAELMDYCTPPQPVTASGKPQGTDEENGNGTKKRKKSQVDGVQGGEGSAQKKRKKKDSNVSNAAESGEIPPEIPGTASTPASGPDSTPRAAKPRNPRVSKKGTPRKSTSSQLVGADSEQPSEQSQRQPDASAYSQSTLNLPPGEAARRREVAFKLLIDANIDPQTLSLEQQNIFANQSPDLQKESLAMLIKYGAERLRIVHPNKDAATGSPPAPPTPVTSTQSSDQTPGASDPATPSGKRKPRKKSDVNGDTIATAGTPKPKQTRGSCESCKARKVKCPKQKPECSECKSNNLSCFYGPPRVRNNKPAKPAEVVQDEQLDEQPLEEEEASDLGSPGFSNTSGLAMPQAIPAEATQESEYTHYSVQQTEPGSSADGLSYPPQPQQAPDHTYHDPSVPPPQLAPELAPQTASKFRSVRASASAARRSLPSAPSLPSGQNQTAQATAASWQSPSVASAQASSLTSPTMVHQTNGRQPKSRKSENTAYHADQPYDNGIQQAASVSHATLQQSAEPTTAARTSSSFQTSAQASRAKSRQDQRPNSRASAGTSASSTYQDTTQAGTSHSTYSTTSVADASSVTSYDPYPHYSTDAPSNQSETRGSYESYSNQPVNATAYPAYDGYSTRSHTAANSTNPVTQSMSPSYSTSTAPSTSQWSTSNSRDTHSYPTDNAAATSSSYNIPQSSTLQHQTAQSFNARPRSTAPQLRSSSSNYSQQSQQPYGSYTSQPQTSSSHQQSNWYGFTPANSSSPSYGSGSRGTGTSGYGQTTSRGSDSYHQQQHRSMNVTGHTYSSIDGGEQDIYDLLRGGTGH